MAIHKITVKNVIMLVARERFELSSVGPKPTIQGMLCTFLLVHYTTGLNETNVNIDFLSHK